MKMNPKFINISLGSFSGATNYAKKLNSTGFKEFHIRGFLETDEWLKYEDVNDWMPYVARTIKTSYDHGGKTYIHFDGTVQDFIGIYSKGDAFYMEGLAAELRYVIDNGLVDKGRVEFFLGAEPLPDHLRKKLNDAIKERKRRVMNDPANNQTQKGNYSINYD